MKKHMFLMLALFSMGILQFMNEDAQGYWDIPCGNEGEGQCNVLQSNNTPCDKGLKLENGVCINDTRRQYLGLALGYDPEVDGFQASWTYWALDFQIKELNRDAPINRVALLGNHNAYNNTADGYAFPNQKWSITDLLIAGIRVIELDVYVDLLPFAKLCHGACGIGDRPFTQQWGQA